MEIVKYEKKGNNNYQVLFSDGKKILINEDVILKYKLLYKKEIDEFMLKDILTDNANYDIYNKCVKYISVRMRSVNEMREFMERKGASSEVIDKTIDKLLKNKLLDDDAFTKAYVNDKIKFSTLGPYRIAQDLKKQYIDDGIITKYISSIDEDFLYDKIDKQITKLIKSNHNKNNLRAKIYHNLVNSGYSQSMIIDIINKYDFN